MTTAKVTKRRKLPIDSRKTACSPHQMSGGRYLRASEREEERKRGREEEPAKR